MLNEIFAPVCAGCGGACEGRLPVCNDCLKGLSGYGHFCENCGFPLKVHAKVCGQCLSGAGWDRVYIDHKYTGALRNLLVQIKFGYRIAGAGRLGELVKADFSQKYDIVTDVPSHFTRRFRRLAHPAHSLAEFIAAKTSGRYEKVLVRNRKTEYQYKLRRRMRALNVRGAFLCDRDLSGLKILLVDDIITTGATVKECCRVLKKANAERVDVYVLSGGHV